MARRSKGPRVELTVRVKPEVHAAASAVAKARGTTLTELVSSLLERELGVAIEAVRAGATMSKVA